MNLPRASLGEIRRLTAAGAVLAASVFTLAAAPAAAVALTLRVAGSSVHAGASVPRSARAASQFTPPQIVAPEAILIETDRGRTLFARAPERRVAIASTTKLMTAYVTLAREPLTRKLVEQPYAAGSGESLAGLPAGVRFTVAELLRAMLLPSGNDVANSLAIDVGGNVSHFLTLMNAAARKLGLAGTHYSTPAGLDTPGNYSTAADLAKLAGVLLQNPFFASVAREQRAYLPGIEVFNHEGYLLAEHRYLVGVKSGHTGDAGYCFVGAARWHGVHLISVVLGDPSQAQRDVDSIALLRYGLSLYHRVWFAKAGSTYAEVAVNGTTDQVALVSTDSEDAVVRHGAALAVNVVGVPSSLAGPIAAGTQEGTLELTENGALVRSVPLVTAADVPAPPPPPPAPVTQGAALYGIAVPVLAVVGGCSLMLMRRSLRRRRDRA